ncbi:MAG: trimeric intracellular cation channel family protein [Collinsella sp.]
MPVVAAITVTSHASDAMVAIPFWLEMFAVVAASISGVLVAREHKLDLVGAVALAVVCGLGGGLLRDMTLQVGNVYILNQPMALPLSIATAAIIYIFPAIVDKPDKLIPLLDIISVGIYAATGADKALVYGFAPVVCIMMGFFTAVGGGMLRDGFMGVVPGIFQRTNFYAIAAIAGSTSYVSRYERHHEQCRRAGRMRRVTMGLRWLSLRFDIKSPTEEDIARFLHRKK